MALRIGELLLEAGIVSPEQLAQALKAQKESPGKRVGTVLVERGIVTETQLTQALSRQLAVPWVSLWHVDFSRKMLALVPREVADAHCLIPVYVRKVPKQGNTLYIATADPTNQEGLEQVSSISGLPVKPMIASPSDIKNAIRAYYGGEEAAPTTPRSVPPASPGLSPMRPPSDVDAPVVEVVLAEPISASASPPPVRAFEEMAAPPKTAALRPSKAPEKPAPAEERPRRSSRPVRTIALTLLDGTTLQIPAGKSGGAGPTEDGDTLTTRDLVSALRAIAHGASAEDILPNARWEPIVAALLALLLKKHLIADWEFVEEMKKG